MRVRVSFHSYTTHWIPEEDFRVLAIEEPFSCILPDIPIPIIGAMDLIEEDESGTVIITDFKTSGKPRGMRRVVNFCDVGQELTCWADCFVISAGAKKKLIHSFDSGTGFISCERPVVNSAGWP
jgi:putative RecB family exonuclease